MKDAVWVEKLHCYVHASHNNNSVTNKVEGKNTNLLLACLSQAFVHFFQVVFVKNYSEPNILYTLNLYSFLIVEEKVSHSCQTADKIIVSDFLIILPRTRTSTDNIISWNLSIS